MKHETLTLTAEVSLTEENIETGFLDIWFSAKFRVFAQVGESGFSYDFENSKIELFLLHRDTDKREETMLDEYPNEFQNFIEGLIEARCKKWTEVNHEQLNFEPEEEDPYTGEEES